MKRRLCALAFLLVTAFATLVTAAPPPETCAAPGDLSRLRGRLPRTALRLARHEPLRIVAIGSSSTEGSGASAPDRTYPAQLAAEFRRRLPGQPVTIVNKGVGGETAIDMAARFERDVFAERPDLVIWQLGTNSVLRDAPIAPVREAVQNGIGRLKDAGIDVVLMDAQYAPAVLAHPLYRDMERALATIGKEEGVPVFRRFALMRHWIATEQLDFMTMLSPDGLHLNDLSYRCIGRLLGDAVVDAALPSLITSHR
jgi:acyl-CoA thioesterase-1